ncbi:hypothetical protein POSPLADRAFT_1043294 [Postia placenta MAD-698-R-SB12]|uniref:Nucleoside phosphorylase domain-containing protein n=1 Tax=Postia placenta MAD-698-R-SB12 TaxID=670580 RepID=A0A1X6NHR1_9APHY|nr:hypothetical protein POSPLADRAFT_1043294 [Postia placenta MAD-698-R-SB12]OSX68167.1 hypothetical protein POSPLADRAFT_1043294 [Postia placenta MAD-698-R-SB12]
MKDLIVDANFPRTEDNRVYHLGIRAGEVANRIVTVGAPSRARGIALYLDASPKPFTLASERGFTTITGRYKGVPISIVSIGMGYPNADFFVREVRECLSGDMVVVRLGSCGALIDTPVGSVVVPKSSVSVNRNYDFDFVTGHSHEPPYRISKPVNADPVLHDAVPFLTTPRCRSFYSSQGRQTSFPDHNADLIRQLQESHEDLGTLEMETFHILHLAASWPGQARVEQTIKPPISTLPVTPVISSPPQPSSQGQPPSVSESNSHGDLMTPRPSIRAAAAQMVFASRTSQEFITPEQVVEIEAWSGRAVLEALTSLDLDQNRIHPERGSVWAL